MVFGCPNGDSVMLIKRSPEHPPPRTGLCSVPPILFIWGTQLRDRSHIIFASCSNAYSSDLPVRARKNFLNSTHRPMPS